MRKVVRQSPAIPHGDPHGIDVKEIAPPRSRLNPAVGVAVAFTASIILWSILANILRVLVHSIF